MQATLYQTLDARGNHSDVIAAAPYFCKRTDAWFTKGYYLWDTFIDLAHAWGRTAREGRYLILSTEVDYDPSTILDLDQPRNISIIEEYSKRIAKHYPDGKVYLQQILQHIRSLKGCRYEAICGSTEDAFSPKKHPGLNRKIHILQGSKSYMNVRPQKQWCVFDKSFFDGCRFRVDFDTRQPDVSPQAI